MEYPASPIKPVSKLLAAAWIATFVLDLFVYVACVVLAAKGIGWLLPLFATVFLKPTLAWDKKRIRNAFALRHKVKAESFAAEVTYCKGLKLVGSDAGAAYMHNGMICFEGLYSRFRLDPKWVLRGGRVINESSATINLVNRSQTEWIALIINSIKDDGKDGKISSDELGRYVKPWLEEEISDVAQPLFPPTKPSASRWFDVWKIADLLASLIAMTVVSTILLAAPGYGLLEKVLCIILLTLSLAFYAFLAYISLRFGVKLKKQLRNYPDRTDSGLLKQLLKEETEFVKSQSRPQ